MQQNISQKYQLNYDWLYLKTIARQKKLHTKKNNGSSKSQKGKLDINVKVL